MKKSTLLLLLIVSAWLGVQAQAPQTINYQAIIRDNSVNPPALVANQQVGLEITIVDQSNVPVYSETHTATTNAFGLVNIKVGDGNSSSSLADVNWGFGSYSVQTSADITGGINYSFLGMSSLSSVPYALQSANSRSMSDPDSDTRIDMPNNLLDNKIQFSTNGTLAVTIDNSQKVGIGTATPSVALDVVGKIRMADGTEAPGRVLTSNANGEASWQDVSSPPGSEVPVGGIIMWTGAVPPVGWALCDGSNNTPDLRGRFVVGSGQGSGLSNRIVGDTGGQEEVALTTAEMPAHTHGINDPGHSHTWTASRQLAGTDDNNNASELSRGDRATQDIMSKTTSVETTGITIQSEGGSTAHENMPPFYALAYIMKL